MKRQRLIVAVGLLLLLLPSSSGWSHAANLTVYAHRASNLEGAEDKYEWAVRLNFNYPVFLSNLSSLTTVTVDEEADDSAEIVEAPGQGKSHDATRQFIVYSTKHHEKPVSVVVTIDKGLQDSTGKRTLQKNLVYKFVTTETVAVNNINAFYKSTKEKGLKVRLSNYVPPGELSKAVRITPHVDNLKYSAEGRTDVITGDFDYNRDYTIQIAPVTLTVDGRILRAYQQSFKGPGLPREAIFKTNRSVVELLGRQLLSLSISNMPAIKCNLTKIPAALYPKISEKYNDQSVDQMIRWAEEMIAVAEKADADPIFFDPVTQEAEAFFAPEATDKVINYSLPLSFRKNPDKGGAWLVGATDPNNVWKGSASKFVQISDLAISYKVSLNSLLIWTTSFHKAEPVPNVSVALQIKDGGLTFIGKTNEDGVLIVRSNDKFPVVNLNNIGAGQKSEAPLNIENVQWIIAATNNDSSAIKIKDVDLKPTRIQRTKSIDDKPEFSTGYLFTDRGVYKPGENVFFKFVSRKYEDGIKAPVGSQVKIEITNPREDIVLSKQFTLSEFGTCYDKLETKSFFPTGVYTIKATMKSGKDKPSVFTQTFMVQEFKKIRHFVTMDMKAVEKKASEYIGVKQNEELLEVAVSGQYYTGGPVKNGRLKWKAMLVPAKNNVHGFDAYIFGNEDSETRFLESGESSLDSAGKLKFTIPIDQRLMTGAFAIQVSATVLDIDGEPATEVQKYNPRPQYLVGIGNHPTKVETGYSTPIPVVVVNQNGDLVKSGVLEATLMRKDFFYMHKRDEAGNALETWEEGWVKSFSSSQKLAGGEVEFPITLNDGGDYLVEFSYVLDDKKYSSRAKFEVGWTSRPIRGQDEQETINKTEVMMSLNKKEYKTGETAKILFTIPRPAKKSLITIEKSSVLDYKLIEAGSGTISYSLPIKDEYRPNIYVSSLTPVGRSGYPVYSNQSDADMPTIYYGYADISIRNENLGLKLEIDPGIEKFRGRPGEDKKISFKVSNSKGKGVVAEMAVCVVDEAILALTRFHTPDLSSLNQFDLPLAVFQGDLRLNLISQDIFRVLTKPQTGGGMGLGDVSSSLRKDFRPVAFYNPAVVTNRDGMASVEFKLPDTTTAYRVYAVVCDKTAGFVSGQRNMVVTKEFFIEPSLPRFSIQGDKFKFPITLNNKTNLKGNVVVQAKGGIGVELTAPEGKIDLEAQSMATARAGATINGRPEKAVFNFDGVFSSAKEKYSDSIEISIPVYSKFLPITHAQVGDFTERVEIVAPFPKYLATMDPTAINPLDVKARLDLSRTNWAKLTPSLQYLLKYPYGCVEQTSSGVIPLAGLKELAEKNLIPNVTSEEINEFIKSGVDRLLSMQLKSGGFAYWPGGLDPSWWGSLYATYALFSARDAGIGAPELNVEKALNFIKDQLLNDKGRQDPYGDRKSNRALALFILATGNYISVQDFDPFFSDYERLDNQSKALVLMAANRIGYMPKQKLAQLMSKINVKMDPTRDNYFNSTYREIAFCLMAGLELGIPRQKFDQWAGLLIRSLKPDGRWTSTADTGWCLAALGSYYKAKQPAKSRDGKVTVSHGGKTTEISLKDTVEYVEFNGPDMLKDPKITLQSDGKDLINYSLTLVYPENPSATKEKGAFDISKTVENLNGSDAIKIGDVLRVTLTINLYQEGLRDRYEYLVLEDPLPAGITAINSELKTEGYGKEEANGDDSSRAGRYNEYDFSPSHLEIRDNAVRVFKNSIYSGTYKFSYLARAVAEGDFWMRSSRIFLMYQPQNFGLIPGRPVKILGGEVK